MVVIEHEKDDILETEYGRIYCVDEVHVTNDGKTVSYLLQELNQDGDPVAESEWYDSGQIKAGSIGTYEITKENESA